MRETDRLEQSRQDLVRHLRAEEQRLVEVAGQLAEVYNRLNNEVCRAADAKRDIDKQLKALRAYLQELLDALRTEKAAGTNGEGS